MANKRNSTLHDAKREKNDEFYTQLTDIEKELRHYTKHFHGKTVFCNCDDPEYSNFWRYFNLNFDKLQLKRLIATHYETDKQSYLLEMYRDDSGTHTTIKHLTQNGDFRSPESITLLQQADIVVTNPPFSLFREYIAQLMAYDKKFIILGNMNAITYKEFFPLLQSNRVWAGYGFNLSMVYKTPYPNLLEANRKFVIGKGYNPDEGYVKVPAICWYTNLDIPKRHEPLVMVKRYNPELYPHYDNYDAINCDKVADIPMDYFESWGVTHADYALLNKDEWEITRSDAERHWIVPAGGTLRDELREHAESYREHIEAALTQAMYCNGEVGVPITFFDAHNAAQFEVTRFRKGNDGKDLVYSQSVSQSVSQSGSTLLPSLYPPQDLNIAPESLECPLHITTPIAANNSLLNHATNPPLTSKQSEEWVKPNTSPDKSQSMERRAKRLITGYLSAESLKYCPGVIGVPITFLDNYSPDQFYVLGVTLGNTCDYPLTIHYQNATQHNRDKTTQSGSKVNTRAAILLSTPPSNTVYYTAENRQGYLLSIYPRILIQRKV